MRYLLLTLDYEIFGNGTGDVRRHVVEPTERMARICEKHAVPLTIFFEAEEFHQFDQNSRELRRLFGYDPAKEMRQQARELASRGHDVQLHLHPQWHRARLEDAGWMLDEDCLTVDSLFETQEETTEYIRRRKAMLEEISGQPVVAYRAGGFTAQPGERLLGALSASGIQLESSVVKGMKHANPHPLDYTMAPRNRTMWRISMEVAQEDPAGAIWEVPIYSSMGRQWEQLTPMRLKAKFSRNVPRARQRAMVSELWLGSSPRSLLTFLFEPVPIKLDYHNVSPTVLHRVIRRAPVPIDGDLDVLVLIGYTKEHLHDANFERFLRLVATDSSIKVVSFADLASELFPRQPVHDLVTKFCNLGRQSPKAKV